MNIALHSLPVRRADTGATVVLGRETGSTYSYDCGRCGAEHRRGYPSLEPARVLCQECLLATGALVECEGCGTLLDPEERVCRACCCAMCGVPAVDCPGHPSDDPDIADADTHHFHRAHGAGQL